MTATRTPDARHDFQSDATPVRFRVAARHRSRFLLLDPDDPSAPLRPAVLAGRLRRCAERSALPVVGDHVEVIRAADGSARIVAVVRRGSLLRRGAPDGRSVPQPLAANVDTVLVAAPLDRLPTVGRLEREVAIAWDAGARPVVVLTKADLHPDAESAEAAVRGALPGVEVVALSSLISDPTVVLRNWLLAGETLVLIGPSGAGKSTLANALLGATRMRTGAVRADAAGRHTTTHRELLALPNGAWLIDTPGLRSLALPPGSAVDINDGVRQTFADVAELAGRCRFADCRHDREPGCAVRAAIAGGLLDSARLESWQALAAESRYQAARHDAAAAAERRAAGRAGARLLRARLAGKREGR